MQQAPSTDKTLPQIMQAAAEQYGERVAILDGEISLTYLELSEARWQVAAALHQAGLKRGDRVALWAPNVYQWIVAAFGAQTLGIALAPINTRWKGAEVAYALNMSRARLLFTITEFLGENYPAMLADQELPHLEKKVTLQGEAAGCTSWADFLASGAGVSRHTLQALAAQVSPDDIFDIGFTSGTTGAPKGVVTTHGQNIRVFETYCATIGLRCDDNYLVINPFFHSFGLKAGLLASIISGAKILPVLTFDLDTVLAQIERDKVTVLPGAPTIYQSILAHPRYRDYDLSSLRLAMTGAAPVPVELVNKMRNELCFEVVVTAYGLTESSGVVSICRPEDAPEIISATSGRAMDGVEVRCVDSDGNEVPRGDAGEIWVRGFNVMQGYLDDPEATSSAITEEGWLKTGDVGVMDEQGYLDITDRIKDMFIVGGFNCYPAEIENMLCSLEGVAQAAVIGVEDERMGEVASAFLVPNAGAELVDTKVIAWCRDNMANYKVPRTVQVVENLPTNASGKVLKTELRQRAAL
jgi:acyl-CoA synthetase (AMP-forming)/AMP-acid ligase II